MGSFVAGCGWPRVMPLQKTTSSLQLGDASRRGAVFFSMGVVFLSLHRTQAASRCRIRLRFIDTDDHLLLWTGSAEI